MNHINPNEIKEVYWDAVSKDISNRTPEQIAFAKEVLDDFCTNLLENQLYLAQLTKEEAEEVDSFSEKIE